MFRFRLQRVLELRQEAEQAKSRSLADARAIAEDATRAREALVDMQRNSRAQASAAAQRTVRVGHFATVEVVMRSLDERLTSADEQVQQAEGAVADAQSELDAAARDRRVLDRLKERHADVWRAAEAHKDRLQMDEIALARFGRSQDSRDGARASSEVQVGAQPRASTRNDGPNR